MITIYSKDNCPQCLIMKKLCEKRNVSHQIKKLDVDFSQADMLQLTEGKARSYPQVFNGDEYVGDFTAAQKLIVKL